MSLRAFSSVDISGKNYRRDGRSKACWILTSTWSLKKKNQITKIHMKVASSIRRWTGRKYPDPILGVGAGPSLMGWKLALPSWVKLGSSFTKGVCPSLGMGCRPFLLGVEVGPSFSSWDLALPSRGGSCPSVSRLELASPRGWPFLSWVGVGPSFKGLELFFGVVVSLPSRGRCWPWVGPSFLKWRLALASWSWCGPFFLPVWSTGSSLPSRGRDRPSCSEWRLALSSWRGVWPYLEWRLAFLLGVGLPSWSWPSGFGLPYWGLAILSRIGGWSFLLRVGPSFSGSRWAFLTHEQGGWKAARQNGKERNHTKRERGEKTAPSQRWKGEYATSNEGERGWA